MFDTGGMGAGVGPMRAVRATSTSRARPTAEALTALDDAAVRVVPTVLADERRLEVVSALDQVFPDGLRRGTTVGVGGPGSMSLALATVAGAIRSGSWLAALGCDELGLVAAEQAGIPLHRMIMVDLPQRSSWGSVAAALVDAFDVVLLSGTYPVRAADARRLASRSCERGGVIVDVGGVWPEAPDITVEVVDQHWQGLGEGHGVLEAREVVVQVSGRRGVRPRRVPLWLPAPDLTPAAIEPAADAGRHAGADISHLVEDESSESSKGSEGRADEQTVVPLRPTA